MQIYDGKMKLPELIAWVTPHALESKKAELGDAAKKEKLKQSVLPFVTPVDWDDFERRVLQSHKAALVLFADKDGDNREHLDALYQVEQAVSTAINVVYFEVEAAQFDQRFSRQSLPHFRTYSNGEAAEKSSYQVATEGVADVFAQVMQEVTSNFHSNVKEVNEMMYRSLAADYTTAEENPKYVLVYLYDDNEGASFLFRALSAEPALQDDFVFFALSDPNEQLYAGHTLPSVAGVMRENDQHPAQTAFHLGDFLASAQIYDYSLKSLAQLVPELAPKLDPRLADST